MAVAVMVGVWVADNSAVGEGVTEKVDEGTTVLLGVIVRVEVDVGVAVGEGEPVPVTVAVTIPAFCSSMPMSQGELRH